MDFFLPFQGKSLAVDFLALVFKTLLVVITEVCGNYFNFKNLWA